MTYEELNIAISVSLGQKAFAAVTHNNKLLIVQERQRNMINVIDFGAYTQARLDNLVKHLQRLRIHLPE